jgi:hypothetical protein
MKGLQFALSPTQYDFVMDDSHILMLMGPMGEGKSEHPDNEILMADGSIKKAKEIEAGDFLMGDDSTPRLVLSTHSDIDEMVEVCPTKGEPFIVNLPHILCLKRTHTGSKKDGEIVEISVEDFLKKSKTFRNTHHLYHTAVEFPFKPIDIDPYFLGLWLGDGTAKAAHITSPEKEVSDFLKEYAEELGLKLVVDKRANTGKAKLYKMVRNGTLYNPLLSMMRDHDLLDNKHIPHCYKCNTRKIRLKLLAGIIDSDGWVNNGGYQIIQKRERLANDIAYLARSLGFFVSVKARKKESNFLKKPGNYYHIMISGDCSQIPVRVKRKIVKKRRQKKDPLVTSIKEIRRLGKGRYCGFTLDGNGRYLHSDFLVTHNTVAGLVGLIVHAQRCGRDIRCAIIRDTFQNIKTSTKPDIEEYLGNWVRFSDGGKKMVINCNPKVECDLFGIDDPASISKLQGPQYACIWLEEPAPIYEKANAGLPREVFSMALARASRQRGTRMRVQITQNPADEEHWTSILADEPEEYLIAEDGTIIYKKVYRIKRGENRHLSAVTRAANMAAFKGDPAKWQRYVEGEIATVHLGKKVTPGYEPKIHFSDKILPVLKGEAIMMWDGWLHPACILAQYNEIKQLVFHDVLYDEGVGTKELIEEQIIPLLNSPKWKDKITSWRAIGDPSMKDPDQRSIRSSAAREIEKVFKTRFEAGPAKWHTRKEPLNSCFKRLLNGGHPAIILSRSATRLHRALKGAWHYKQDNNGNIIGDKPVKNNAACHIGDAFSYGIAILMPYEVRKKLKKIAEEQKMKRALSYGGTNFRKPERLHRQVVGLM